MPKKEPKELIPASECPPVYMDGKYGFVCPACGQGHEYGPIDGYTKYRCMECGKEFRREQRATA